MGKASINRLIILFSLLTISSNLIHPVTPALIEELELPDFMFGVMFACMSFTTFIFSTFWGKLSDNIGRAKILGVSTIIYGICQFFFSISSTIPGIVAARLLAGIFAGAHPVAALAYMVDASKEEDRSKYLAYFTAFFSISTALGYLFGGLIGNISIPGVFIVQVTTLILVGVVILFLLADAEGKKFKREASMPAIIKESNPFNAFMQSGAVMTRPMATFLAAVFITTMATFAYDSTFNYYIRNQLQFPPSYNGIIKGSIGIIGLLANLTINIWIVKRTNLRKSIIMVFAMCGISLFAVIGMDRVATFLAANIIFNILNLIYLPIQQSLMMEDGDEDSSGLLSGLFNSVRSMGMVTGSLAAGFIYGYGSLIPFAFAAVAFLAGAVISWINLGQYGRECGKGK